VGHLLSYQLPSAGNLASRVKNHQWRRDLDRDFPTGLLAPSPDFPESTVGNPYVAICRELFTKYPAAFSSRIKRPASPGHRIHFRATDAGNSHSFFPFHNEARVRFRLFRKRNVP